MIVLFVLQMSGKPFPLRGERFFFILPPSHMERIKPVFAAFRKNTERLARLPVLIILTAADKERLGRGDVFFAKQRHSFVVCSISDLGRDPGPGVVKTSCTKPAGSLCRVVVFPNRYGFAVTRIISFQKLRIRTWSRQGLIDFLQGENIRLFLYHCVDKPFQFFFIIRFLQAVCI